MPGLSSISFSGDILTACPPRSGNRLRFPRAAGEPPRAAALLGLSPKVVHNAAPVFFYMIDWASV